MKRKIPRSVILMGIGGFLILTGVGIGIYLRSSHLELGGVNSPGEAPQRITTTGIENGEQSPSKPFVQKNYSPETQGKIDVITQILRSKNDNDPRLDTDFQNLSSELKEALKELYSQMTPEDRNGRGTIAFLLARSLSSPEELRFFSEVVSEAPCLSLADCSKEAHTEGQGFGDHEDQELGGEVTLAYPQLVTLQWFERILEDDKRPAALKKAIIPVLEQARRSKSDKVSIRADELLKQVGKNL